MREIFADSVYFGFFLCLATYFAGIWLKKRVKCGLFHPLLVSIVLCILFLVVFQVPYEDFNQGAEHLNYLLTPATVCLALPLYRQIKILKQYWLPVLCGLAAGCASTMVLVIAMCRLLLMDQKLLLSLLPKSITTAIAIGISDEIGGLSPVTVAAVIVTGIFGAVVATAVFRLFRIQNPVAQGLALGAASHAIGTTKALEMGEVQGAMSSLAIVVSGMLTVVVAPIVSSLI